MKKFLFRAIWCVAAVGASGLAVLAAWLCFDEAGQRLLAQASERSPNEHLRYLERRLLGHPPLEGMLLPVLRHLRARLEPDPPAASLPHLGKGQRDTPPASVTTLNSQRRVDSPQAIRDALMQASPGTAILVAPGLYLFDHTLRLGKDGGPHAPIALLAERPGTVWFEFRQEEGILVDRPYWRFENLNIRGTCPQHHDCEHAFHVVGRGHRVSIVNNRLQDFNAPVKVNGTGGDWPDGGVLAWNTIGNTAPRQTDRPVVMFDLVGADHWRVHDNHVSNFVKAQGNRVSYGLFAKGSSEGTRFERNLVVCTTRGVSQPGERVGISFGGGGTGPSACRRGGCVEHEHRGGLGANNVVAHCNDAGLDANHALDTTLAHNTLINTSGISVRNASSVRTRANLSDGGVWLRDGSRADRLLDRDLGDFFDPAAALVFAWKPLAGLSNGETPAFVESDFYDKRRKEITLPGAFDLP